MKIALQRGNLSEEFFIPSPSEYMSKMSTDSEFVDNLFLQFFASITGHDIIVLPLHSEAAAVNGEFTWIFGKGK